MQLEPGAILASLQGRGTITIVSVDACVTALVDDHVIGATRADAIIVWVWPRRSTERTLHGMGFALVGQEDPDVLAERVALAQAKRAVNSLTVERGPKGGAA